MKYYIWFKEKSCCSRSLHFVNHISPFGTKPELQAHELLLSLKGQ